MCKGTNLGGRCRLPVISTPGSKERFSDVAFGNCFIPDHDHPYAFGNYVQTLETHPKARFLTASPPASMHVKPTKVIDIMHRDAEFLDFQTNLGSDDMSNEGTTAADCSEKANANVAVGTLKDREIVESSYKNGKSKQNAYAIQCGHVINLNGNDDDVSSGKANGKVYRRREGDKGNPIKDSYSMKDFAEISKIRDLEWLDLASIARAQASSNFYKRDINYDEEDACRSVNYNHIQACPPLTRPGGIKAAAKFQDQLKLEESRIKELERLLQRSKADQKTQTEVISDLLLAMENLENEAGKWKRDAERQSAEIMALVCRMYEIEDAGRRRDSQQQLKMQNLEVQLQTFQLQCRCKKLSCRKRLSKFLHPRSKKLLN